MQATTTAATNYDAATLQRYASSLHANACYAMATLVATLGGTHLGVTCTKDQIISLPPGMSGLCTGMLGHLLVGLST